MHWVGVALISVLIIISDIRAHQPTRAGVVSITDKMCKIPETHYTEKCIWSHLVIRILVDMTLTRK